jgi:hypothetical protein
MPLKNMKPRTKLLKASIQKNNKNTIKVCFCHLRGQIEWTNLKTGKF